MLSAKHRIGEDCIVIGAGAAELIAASIRGLRARTCLCPIPAFSEYRFACTASGCDFDTFQLKPEEDFHPDVDKLCELLDRMAYDVLILNNPHNPSGVLLPPDMVLKIIDAAKRVNTSVILDEAFVDYCPSASLTRDAAADLFGHCPPLVDQVLWLPGIAGWVCGCDAFACGRYHSSTSALAGDGPGAQRRCRSSPRQ